MISHVDKSGLLKISIRRNKITLGRNICTQNMKVTYENDIPWTQFKITHNLDSQKIKLRWASIIAPRSKRLHIKLVFRGTRRDYSKSRFAENKITWGLIIFTQNMNITYENVIPWGQINITQNRGPQKIRLHWTSICLPRTWGLHMEMIFHGDKYRLLKIWNRRKCDYNGPQYFYTSHKRYIWEWYPTGDNQN